MQIAYNDRLFLACTTRPIAYDRIEELLTAGAQPLGAVSIGDDPGGCLYTDVIDAHLMDRITADELYRITQLFLQYGMRFDKPLQMRDDCVHPLWEAAFLQGDVLIAILQLLLENGLDAENAGICWEHAYTDLILAPDGKKYGIAFYEDIVHLLMLLVSFDHIRDRDEALRDCFWCSKNDYPTRRLRNWDAYDLFLEEDGTIDIAEHATGKIVWTFRFSTQS